MLAGAIFAGLLGTIYTAAAEDETESIRLVSVVSPEMARSAPLPPHEAPIPTGHDASDDIAAMLDAEREIVDPETGVRLGLLRLRPAEETSQETREEAQPGPRRQARARRRTPPRPPAPRLHADPGRHVVAVARAMIARREAFNVSCYRYLTEVFERAGHGGWRTRSVVYQGDRDGPYADLGLIRPGDWLYIVNHPNRTPVGTHSVLFVGWEDRARGYARVIEHPGWGAARPGQERGYDVSRTYRITRPVLRR
ncbi:MAG TPA: hypothetical protein DEF51_08335 [Myxococcales bacterium]|nr:hypothetical protein [Myxococcales bacterium]